MSQGQNHKPFIFNSEIDTQAIQDLYGDDYSYIEEVFATVLKDYDALAATIASAYASRDLPALKTAVHKIKPVFGFVGLLAVQQECQQFEHICQSAGSFSAIEPDYAHLHNNLQNSKSLIEEEKRKLGLFNNQRA